MKLTLPHCGVVCSLSLSLTIPFFFKNVFIEEPNTTTKQPDVQCSENCHFTSTSPQPREMESKGSFDKTTLMRTEPNGVPDKILIVRKATIEPTGERLVLDDEEFVPGPYLDVVLCDSPEAKEFKSRVVRVPRTSLVVLVKPEDDVTEAELQLVISDLQKHCPRRSSRQKRGQHAPY